MNRPLTGAAKRAHERRILRDGVEREMTLAHAHIARRDPGSVEAVMRHVRRAAVLQEVAR